MTYFDSKQFHEDTAAMAYAGANGDRGAAEALTEAMNVVGMRARKPTAWTHDATLRASIWPIPPLRVLRRWAKRRLGWDNATLRDMTSAQLRQQWRTRDTLAIPARLRDHKESWRSFKRDVSKSARRLRRMVVRL